MIWNQNNVCENLFSCLADAGQLDITYPFLTAGNLTMNQLQFFDKMASPSIIKNNATMLAARLDSSFISLYTSSYAAGQNSSTSTNAMIQVLINEVSTLSDLAGAVDACYIFNS